MPSRLPVFVAKASFSHGMLETSFERTTNKEHAPGEAPTHDSPLALLLAGCQTRQQTEAFSKAATKRV